MISLFLDCCQLLLCVSVPLWFKFLHHRGTEREKNKRNPSFTLLEHLAHVDLLKTKVAQELGADLVVFVDVDLDDFTILFLELPQ